MTDPVQFELMRPAQIAAARRRCPVAYLAVGPLEWHGPHLPLGTDAITAHRVAVSVAQQVGGVVLPVCHLGTETVRLPDGPQGLRPLGFRGDERVVGMDFPGNSVKSLYIEEGVFAVVVRDLIRLLKQNDYRLIVIVNGHGAPNHQRALRRVALEETDPPRVRVLFERAGAGPLQPSHDPGHAGRGETAVMMAALPDSVDITALPPKGTPLRYPDYGIVNGAAFEGRPTEDFTVPTEADPRLATREEGIEMFRRNVERLAGLMRRYIDEHLREPGV